jgi:uncharacterized protein (DUF2141 family)
MKPAAALLALLMLPGIAFAKAPPTTTLTVTIKKVKDAKGTVRVGLFSLKDRWPVVKDASLGANAKARKGTLKVSISGVKAGTWAVALFHDEDDDGEIDKSFIGIPTEGYGFSRDASATFGPPDFEDAAFKVADKPVHQAVTMVY